MSRYEKGQMVKLSWVDENGYDRWQYMVCLHTYDNMTHFLKEYGGKFSESYTSQEEEYSGGKGNVSVIPLYQNGKPVFSKRTFFGLGRYTFEPTTKRGK